MSYSKLQLKPLQHKRQLSMSIRPRFHELLTNHKKQFRRKQEENISKCPKCGGNLVLRTGKYGKFIGCSNYPKCTYTKEKKY